MTAFDDHLAWHLSHSWEPYSHTVGSNDCVLVRTSPGGAMVFRAARLSCAVCGTVSAGSGAGTPVGVDFSVHCGSVLARRVMES